MSRIRQGDGDAPVALQYNSEIFSERTIARMMDHFRSLLESAVADPGKELARLSLLLPAELTLVREWNATSRDYGHTTDMLVSGISNGIRKTVTAHHLCIQGSPPVHAPSGVDAPCSGTARSAARMHDVR
jgi:non-ribosomal peptide synthetase component F